MKGCDYAWQAPDPVLLYQEGYRFAVRYVSYDPSKNLTNAEAVRLDAAGLALVTNWEWGRADALDGWGRGVQHAQRADQLHRAIGGPPDRPIYFSVDFDAQPAQLPAVRDYLHGLASVLTTARTGVYGGLRVVSDAFDAGLVKYGWQTAAWSAGQWEPRAQLRQLANGVRAGGAVVDEDQALSADYGQWGFAARPNPLPTWTETLIMDLPTLSLGATGLPVGRVQGLLVAAGYPLTVDRVWGPITDRAVRRFQGTRALLVDGIVGQHTWTALLTG